MAIQILKLIYILNLFPLDTYNKCINLTNSHMTGIEARGPESYCWVGGRCVVGGICWKPKTSLLHSEFFIVGRFLFVYFILNGKNAEVSENVLVANIPWCPSDSSKDFRLSALYNVFVSAARVPP